MPENAKRQKLSPVDEGREKAVDRISDLPDSLLLHILSFVEAHEIVKTSLLSKRWKSLWASVTTLNFSTGKWVNSLCFVTYVNSFLMLREGQKVCKFRARFDSRGVQHVCIDSWFNYLKRRGVEELDFDFSRFFGCLEPRIIIEPEKYVICNSLFDCKVLRVMRLRGCDVDPTARFCFNLLKELRLDNVNISTLDLSCCPLLECLTLRHCNKGFTLDIHAPSTKLRNLTIIDSFVARNEKLVLCAPHVSSIAFCESCRVHYDMKDLSSLTKVYLKLRLLQDEDGLIGLIEAIGGTPTFVLSSSCLEALAYAILNTGDIPSFNIVTLEIQTDLSRLDIWLITHVLRIFPYVESLIFNVCTKWEHMAGLSGLVLQFSRRSKLAWESLGRHFVSAADGITKVEIINFLKNKLSQKHKYSYGDSLNNMIGFLNLADNEEMKSVKLLLQSCSMLKEMDIKITNMKHVGDSFVKSDFLLYLNNTVQRLPRISKNVEISVS